MSAKFCRHGQANSIMLIKNLFGVNAEVFKESRFDQGLRLNRLRILAPVKRELKIEKEKVRPVELKIRKLG